MSLLPYLESQNILHQYDLNSVETRVVEKEEDLALALKELGWPVVMKTDHEELIHKTEAGGVKTNLQTEEEAQQAWQELHTLHPRVVIQKQIRGEEIIIGGKRDEVFGPVLMVGLGGVLVEIYQDIAFRLAPVTKNEALAMIEEIKGKKLLEGFRGRRVIDKEELAAMIVKTGDLLVQEEQIQELDFNPVIAAEQLLICDIKIIL